MHQPWWFCCLWCRSPSSHPLRRHGDTLRRLRIFFSTLPLFLSVSVLRLLDSEGSCVTLPFLLKIQNFLHLLWQPTRCAYTGIWGCARTKDNNFLSKFELFDIPPAPRGAQVDVMLIFVANLMVLLWTSLLRTWRLGLETPTTSLSLTTRVISPKRRLIACWNINVYWQLWKFTWYQLFFSAEDEAAIARITARMALNNLRKLPHQQWSNTKPAEEFNAATSPGWKLSTKPSNGSVPLRMGL